MAELLIVLTIGAVAVLVAAMEPEALMRLGWLVAMSGLLLSTAAGLVYHLRLRTALVRAGRLPPRWWWSPTRFHGRLEAAARETFMRWFVAGGISFGVCVLGLVFVVIAAVKAGLRVR